MKATRTARMAPDERRESILAAATQVFGDHGYLGSTTDQIAAAAGISQAYVVRMFGSKEALFVEAGRRAVDRVIAEFRAAIATFDSSTPQAERVLRVATAYSNLIADRGTLLTLMHFCTLGHDPTFGPMARSSYLDIYRVIRDEAGFPPQAAVEFLARGMLINTLMGLHMPLVAEDDADARELLACTFEGKSEILVAIEDLYTATRP